MKFKILLVFLALSTVISGQQNKDFAVQSFLPQIFDQFPNVRDLAIDTETQEVFFTLQDYQGKVSFIGTFKKKKDRYTNPVIASFSGKYKDLEPFLSPDGLRLYFVSNRPLNSSSNDTKDYDIWYVDRVTKDANWSSPKNLGAPVNTTHNEFYPAVTASGKLYFTSDKNKEQLDDIYVSEWRKNGYSEPQALGNEVNSKGFEFNAFVNADDTVLLFSGYNRPDGYGGGDLYISFKDKNGIWSNAKNLGKQINSDAIDYCPFYDEKTGILYFTSKRSTIPTSFEIKQNLNEILKKMDRTENGLSKFYQIKLNTQKLKIK